MDLYYDKGSSNSTKSSVSEFNRGGAISSAHGESGGGVDGGSRKTSGGAMVSRIVRGTAIGAGGPVTIVTLGGLVGITDVDFSGGSDAISFATNLAVWANTNKATIPALSVVDNLNGTFDITFNPGAAANTIPTTTNEGNLSFAETQAGVG